MNTQHKESVHRPEQTELAALLTAIAGHDEDALMQLHRRTVARVFRLAQAMTGSREDADEIVTDVYWQVWRRAGQYDARRGTVIAWLIINCRSLALDLLRRRRASQTKRARWAEQVEADPVAVTGSDLIGLLEENSTVHRALGALSDDQSRLIAMAFFKDMSHAEIATALQLPLGTVKSTIRRGLGKLRQALQQCGLDNTSR